MTENDQVITYQLLPMEDETEYHLIQNYNVPMNTKESDQMTQPHIDASTGSTLECSLTLKEKCDIKELLETWNLSILFPAFCDELINLNVIQNMSDRHIQKFVNKYNLKIGTDVILESKIKAYQILETTEVAHAPLQIENDKYQTDENSSTCDDVTIDVHKILEKFVQGRSVLSIYKSTKKLSEDSRSLIVDAVIKYMLQKGIRMNVVIAQQISEKIIQIFPSEFIAYYYSKQSGRKPQGKVYDKYFNSLWQLKTSGIIPTRSYTTKSPCSNFTKNIQLAPPESNITEQLEAILLDNCSWAEMEHLWEATKNYRLHEISNANSTNDILTKWKQYKKPMGYKLINIDFNQMYPSASSLILNYEIFAAKIMPIYLDKIKDHSSKTLLNDLQHKQYVTESGRSCTLFFLLHSLLVPTTTTIEGTNNKRLRTKFSISDSQRSFLIVGNTLGECEEEIIRRNKNKVPIQPLILIIGTTLEPKEFLVFFDEIKYVLNSFVEAVDICFKTFNVLNLQYPIESHLVWTFIQKYFYSIDSSYDKHNVNVNCLISALRLFPKQILISYLLTYLRPS